MNSFLESLADNYLWGLIIILLLNIQQRRIPRTNRKRAATLYIAILFFILNLGVVVVLETKISPYWALLPLFAVIVFAVIKRDRIWPFRLHCQKCGKRLNFNHVVGHDDNCCDECWYEMHPEDRPEEQIEEVITEDDEKFEIPDDVENIDWDTWEADERCTLLYCIQDNKVLLIDKKQGLGTGLVNAPGGHIELEETADEAALREFNEETGMTCDKATLYGTLHFQFKDGLTLKGYIYRGEGCTGELTECDEARPFWCDLDKLPYDRMWADDLLWLPSLLEGKRFTGYFIFDDKKMLSSRLNIEEE